MEDNKREQALQLLRRLAAVHGAPGRENSVRRIIREILGRGVSTDKSGNIFCEKRGTAETPRIMLTAHMDEVGLVVQTISKKGLLKFAPLGGWWPHTLLAQRVRILTQAGTEIVGVIGAKPPHFLTESEREQVMKIEDMFIDVGAVDDIEVREKFGIRLGDAIVPDSPFAAMGNPDYLLCKAFDNRVGVALMLQILQMLDNALHPNVVCGAGTVQEELGVRGAQTAVFGLNPDVAVVLEGTPADDLPGTPEDEWQGALGRGVQIRVQDPSAIMNRAFVDYVINLAESCNIPHQIAVRKSGGTDARAIHLHGRGVPTVVLGVPARYIHTHNSMIHLVDYLSALELVDRLIHCLDERATESFTAFID